EPFVRYNYIPVVNQNDLPLYDYNDRVNAQNLVTYGAVTRLLGKFGADTEGANPPPSVRNEFLGNDLYGPPLPPQLAGGGDTQIRELARAYVQNSYSLSRPIAVPLVGTNPNDQGTVQTINTHITGIDGGLQITPVTFAAARTRAVYSVAQNHLLYAEVGANLY